MKLEFEWDAHKAARNIEKHHISFEEAATVFDDPVFITLIDEEHSLDEELNQIRGSRRLKFKQDLRRRSMMVKKSRCREKMTVALPLSR